MRGMVIGLLWMLLAVSAAGQIVYQDLTNRNIYDFLDELANLKIITLNSVVKPYSRGYIAGKLREAEKAINNGQLTINNEQLTINNGQLTTKISKRLVKELQFYLQDYQLEGGGVPVEYKYKLGFIGKGNTDVRLALNPLQFVYKDSLFTFVVKPIFGVSYVVNENGSAYHRWNGGELFGYIGSHFGYYASLRDNHEDQRLTSPVMLNQEEGAVWKSISEGGSDYSEMRAGITWQWRWGDLTFAKDHIEWGDNYHGSILNSGRAPSWLFLKYHMKPVGWFDFTWLHGWLVSEVPDSSKSYPLPGGNERVSYFDKFYSVGIFSFTPIRGLDLAIGNSVIYCSDVINPAYLSPFLFYFNYGYAEGSGESAMYGKEVQTFFNISSRNVQHLHLYGSVFVNQFNISGLSWKAGMRLSDWPLPNLSFTAEFTRNNGNAYSSALPTTSYTSNQYALGSYLKNNSMELYAALSWKPIRGLHFNASFTHGEHGEGDSLERLDYDNTEFSLSARYEVINNAYLFTEYLNRHYAGDIRYIPAVYSGNTNSLVCGINIGF